MSSKPFVLVLGATGFVGKNLLAKLCGLTANVTAVYRSPRATSDTAPVTPFANIKWVDAGAGLGAVVRHIAASDPIDVVIHLAGRVNGTPQEVAQGNSGVTLELLRALDEAGRRPRIVYLSSVSAIDRLGQYGTEKRSAEDAIVGWGSDYICLRSSLIYGPYDSNNVAKLIGAVRRWPVIPVPGGRTVSLQPLYVDDLCDVICHAAFETKATGLFVVAGPRQEKLWDMLQIIQQALSRHQMLVPVPLSLLQWASSVLIRIAPRLPLPMQQINTLHNHAPWPFEQAKEALGFSPRIFADGIAQFLKAPSGRR